jgi:uncharacterized protein (TIGR02391 family)
VRGVVERLRRQFLLGEYELAALAALKQVEIRVRDLSGGSEGDIGVRLVRQAFNAENGVLADPEQEMGERQATADLFAGAIGVFKNPSSHREVQFDDPTYASEVVLLAELCLERMACGGGVAEPQTSGRRWKPDAARGRGRAGRN